MAAVSLFGDTNTAALTSRENRQLVQAVSMKVKIEKERFTFLCACCHKIVFKCSIKLFLILS